MPLIKNTSRSMIKGSSRGFKWRMFDFPPLLFEKRQHFSSCKIPPKMHLDSDPFFSFCVFFLNCIVKDNAFSKIKELDG